MYACAVRQAVTPEVANSGSGEASSFEGITSRGIRYIVKSRRQAFDARRSTEPENDVTEQVVGRKRYVQASRRMVEPQRGQRNVVPYKQMSQPV